MPISNNITEVQLKRDTELLLKTSSVKDGKYLVYTTDGTNGPREHVVFQNDNNGLQTTQFVEKDGFDATVRAIKNDNSSDPIAINFTQLSDMPKDHPLSGLNAVDNSAVLDLAKASIDSKVKFETLDKVINLQTESFKNVTSTFQAGLDKFKLPTDPITLGKNIIKDAKNAIKNILGVNTTPKIDIITTNQKDTIQKNATKITQTQDYMVKLEQWNQNTNEKLTTWNPDLGLLSSIVFTVMPIVDENRSASYDSLTPTQHPGSIQVYKTTSSRTFNINGKFVSRSIDEANKTLKYLNTIRSWVMPYYGSGTAESYPNKIGLPPEILRFNAYGDKNLKDIPVVLTNYSWTYPEDVDYVQAVDSDNKSYPVPRIIEISLSIMECYAPNESSKFDLLAYKNGDLNKAYGR